ncbi:MAG TPA: hypothetical protein VIU37_08500, partial [Candidatus Limnocylindrales bacterium]
MNGNDLDLRLVPVRPLICAPVDVVFRIAPGDRPVVATGDSVVVGAPIAQRLRDARLDELTIPATATPRPGRRWTAPSDTRDGQAAGGEYVFGWRGR